MKKQVAIIVLFILAVMSFTASVAMALDCDCGDICVNETGWWCAGGEFNSSGTPIQAAIDNASACCAGFSCADPCIICATDGTYTENVDVYTSNLVIKSENGAASTTVNAADTSDKVFDVQADCITIDGFTISDATNAYGIYLNYGDSYTIKNNHITSNWFGISAYSSDNLIIENNVIYDNSRAGIDDISEVGGVTTISGNKIYDNSVGIDYIEYIFGGLNICDNEIHDNGGDGIRVICNVDGVTTISGNKIYENGDDGIEYIQNIYNNLNICDNAIYCNDGDGIYNINDVYGVTTISGNKIYENDGRGIGTSADDTVISDNQIHDNAEGIWVNSDDNTIVRNMIERNPGDDTGVHLTGSADGNEINENGFIDNGQQAFDDGAGNNWDGNYWSPPPGEGPDDYTIPGPAGSEDSAPLPVCPLIPGENQPPEADANGPYVANEGTTIAFDASGSSDPDDDPLLYRWDFDDDGTWDTGWSGAPAAINTWFDDWVGTARVEVSDIEFTDFDTAAVTVDNVAPLVDAGPDQTVDEGDAVDFDGSFTDPGLEDTHTYEWLFGDGWTASGTLTPTHTYADDGVYLVELTVTDDDGGVSSDILTVTVDDVDPIADFSGTPMSGPAPLEVDFTDETTTYDGIVGWDWDFGDGGGSTVQNPTHVYTTDGTYGVSLTAHEADDDSDTETKVDYITVSTQQTNQPPVADANGPYEVPEGTTIAFDASGSSDPDGDPLEYRWDFDNDGTWDTGWSGAPGASNTWFDDRTGTARVEVRDGEFTDTTTAEVTVNNVAPLVEAGDDQTVDEGDAVDFAGSFTDPGLDDIHDIAWDFGDSATASGTLTPTHTYVDDGDYTVTLTVEDDDGGVGTDTLAVTVTEGEVQQSDLCPDEYRWGDPAPGYSFAGWPIFESWMDAHFVNSGPGDAYNVVASISYAPANVKIVDGYVTLGDIPAGSGAWSSDSFTLKVDMTNPQGPDESVKWTVEYDDAAGVHHVVENVPQFCAPG